MTTYEMSEEQYRAFLADLTGLTGLYRVADEKSRNVTYIVKGNTEEERRNAANDVIKKNGRGAIATIRKAVYLGGPNHMQITTEDPVLMAILLAHGRQVPDIPERLPAKAPLGMPGLIPRPTTSDVYQLTPQQMATIADKLHIIVISDLVAYHDFGGSYSKVTIGAGAAGKAYYNPLTGQPTRYEITDVTDPKLRGELGKMANKPLNIQEPAVKPRITQELVMSPQTFVDLYRRMQPISPKEFERKVTEMFKDAMGQISAQDKDKPARRRTINP